MNPMKPTKTLLIIILLTLTTPIVHAENQKPQPAFTSPTNTQYTSDTITITDNTITLEATDLTGENDITSATFELQQTEYQWIYLGFDNTPNQPTLQLKTNKTTNTLGGTQWTATWDLRIFAQDYYTLRVTLRDTAGQTGSTTLTVYYDPDPPKPTLDYNTETPKIHGNHTIKTIPTGNNLETLTITRLNNSNPEITQNGLGDANQYNTGPSINNTNNYGAPTAAANAIWRLTQTTTNPTQLAQNLAQLCKTNPQNGTASHDLTTGMKKYLIKENLTPEYYTQSFVSSVNQDGTITGKPKWTRYWDALKRQDSAVLLLSNPGADGVPATTDDETQYYTGQSGNQIKQTISLQDPNGPTTVTGTVKPTPNLSGFESIWLDINQDNNMTTDEIWYLLGVWTIGSHEKPWITIDQDDTPINGLQTYWNTTTVPDGYYIIRATIRDNRDLEGNTYTTFYVNNHPPTQTQLDTPTLPDIGQTMVSLHWTQCPDNDFQKYEIYKNNTLIKTINEATTLTTMLTDLNPDQKYKITLKTIDNANEFSESTVYVKTKPTESGQPDLDTEAPQVSISPIPTLTNTNDLTIEWSTNEPVTKTTYTLDQSPPIETSEETINLNDLSDGTHTIVITVEDYAGHTGEAQTSFTVDTTAPVIATPQWSIVATEDRYLINIGVTVIDDTTEITDVTCVTTELTSTTPRLMIKNNDLYTCSFLTQKANLPLTFKIQAEDTAGNTAVNDNQQQGYSIEYQEPSQETSPTTTILIAGLAVITIIALGLIINIIRRTRV